MWINFSNLPSCSIDLEFKMLKIQRLKLFCKKYHMSFVSTLISMGNSFISFRILLSQLIDKSFPLANSFMFLSKQWKYFVMQQLSRVCIFIIKVNVNYKHLAYCIIKVRSFQQKIKLSPTWQLFLFNTTIRQWHSHSKTILITFIEL